MKPAELRTREVLRSLERVAPNATIEDAYTLRKAEATLHRWHELECGDGNNYSSWSIERDEETDIPYMCVYPHDGKARRRKIVDRETGAIKRIAKVCQRLGLHYFIQGDPRGAALYVDREPLPNNNYTQGVLICGR